MDNKNIYIPETRTTQGKSKSGPAGGYNCSITPSMEAILNIRKRAQDINCANCGAPFEGAPSYAFDYFCSAECFYEDWLKEPKLETYACLPFASNFDKAHAKAEILYEMQRQNFVIAKNGSNEFEVIQLKGCGNGNDACFGTRNTYLEAIQLAEESL